jgi:hypothetical protein
MKINLADSSKDPSLKSLHQIMLELAEDAREEQKQIVLSIEKAIQMQLAKMQKEYRFKKLKKQLLLWFVVPMDLEKYL